MSHQANGDAVFIRVAFELIDVTIQAQSSEVITGGSVAPLVKTYLNINQIRIKPVTSAVLFSALWRSKNTFHYFPLIL